MDHSHTHAHYHAHSYKNILIAFLLNLTFSILEFFGGVFTGSVAIISDAVHDAGDALVIGISYFLEKKSYRAAEAHDDIKAKRYSLLGAAITTGVLTIGSVIVIVAAIRRIWHPIEVNYGGMLAFAIFGVVVNGVAAFATSHGESLNQRAVNLHMLEDVLGWVAVLIGSIIMYFTSWAVIDPIMSILISAFILLEALKNGREIVGEYQELAAGSKEDAHGENDL